jgi:hypothetical protein
VGSVAGTGCACRRWDRQDGQRTISVGDAQGEFKMLISALVTFLVVILILYLINMLPIDGRAKQIARVVVIVLGVISLLKYIAVF